MLQVLRTILVDGSRHYQSESIEEVAIEARVLGLQTEQRDFGGLSYFRLVPIDHGDTIFAEQVLQAMEAVYNGGAIPNPDLDKLLEKSEENDKTDLASTAPREGSQCTTLSTSLPQPNSESWCFSKKALISTAVALVTTILLRYLGWQVCTNAKHINCKDFQTKLQRLKENVDQLIELSGKVTEFATLYLKLYNSIRVLADGSKDMELTPIEAAAWSSFVAVGVCSSGPVGQSVAAAGIGGLAFKKAYWG